MKHRLVIYESMEEYENVTEDMAIINMVKERTKKDNGKRYSLDELETILKFKEQ